VDVSQTVSPTNFCLHFVFPPFYLYTHPTDFLLSITLFPKNIFSPRRMLVSWLSCHFFASIRTLISPPRHSKLFLFLIKYQSIITYVWLEFLSTPT
jgi:hypothetical protein